MENEVSKSGLVADRTEKKKEKKKTTVVAKWGYSLRASHKCSNVCSHAEKRKLITRVKTVTYFSEWFLPPSTEVKHVHSNPVSGWRNSIIRSDISDFQKYMSFDFLQSSPLNIFVILMLCFQSSLLRSATACCVLAVGTICSKDSCSNSVNSQFLAFSPTPATLWIIQGNYVSA